MSNTGGGIKKESFLYDYYVDSITAEQMKFAKKINLSGKVQSHNGSPLKTNSKYQIYMSASITPSDNRIVSKTTYFSHYKNPLGVVGFTGSYFSLASAPPGWSWDLYSGDSRLIIIPADDPSVIVTNITTNNATISWDTNNKNPSGTSYTLQYQTLKEAGDTANESDWGDWEDILVGGTYNTTELGVISDSFQPDNTYRLRVRVNHTSGASYDCYSDYVIFSTSADPAVRSAQEAAIAAQAAALKASAAEQAAKDTLQYSSDAKDAAVQAQETSDSVLSQVNHSTYGLEAIYNKIDTNTLPDIKKVYNPQGATATNTSSYEVKINATGIKSNLRYRVTCDGFDSGWTDSNTISISALTIPGVKTTTVMVSNNPINPDQGAIAEDSIRFFKI